MRYHNVLLRPRFVINCICRSFSSSRQTDNSFIHPSSTLIGNIKLGQHVSIWPNVVIRAGQFPFSIVEFTVSMIYFDFY